MSQMQNLYETTFIVNASLEDTQIETVITHTQEIITKNGGEIKALNKWGRKRLTYSIQKKNNGFYVNLDFSAHPSTVSQLERAFTLDENILRFLTIRIDKKALKAREQAPVIIESAEQPKEISPIAKEPLFDDDIEISIP
jgi:small subunit ribosomal protein S6